MASKHITPTTKTTKLCDMLRKNKNLPNIDFCAGISITNEKNAAQLYPKEFMTISTTTTTCNKNAFMFFLSKL